MSQSTDTTQVMPLADSPQAQVDPDATVTMPVITAPISATMSSEKAQQFYPSAPSAPAVPVVPPQPAFDPVRARLLHLHRVLGRILNTASLPAPDRTDLHAYGNGIELLLHDDLDADAVKAYMGIFGGTVTQEERPSSWSASGMQRYAELLTVVDGVEVRVWSLTDLPAAEQPAPEPAVVVLDEAPAAEQPIAASEPEPQHDPAPVPQPETPVEHPEAA